MHLVSENRIWTFRHVDLKLNVRVVQTKTELKHSYIYNFSYEFEIGKIYTSVGIVVVSPRSRFANDQFANELGRFA